jgi:hypothetical protein
MAVLFQYSSVSVRLAPAISYFEDMNIPGADFCAVNYVRAIVDYKLKEAKPVHTAIRRPGRKRYT